MRPLVLLIALAGCSDRAIGPDDPELPGADAGATAGPSPCAGLDQVACGARPDCHGLFTADEPCDNLCCDSHFHACETGARADCAGPPACNEAPPSCHGEFVPAIGGGCWVGCVPAYECASFTGTCRPSADCPSGTSCIDPTAGKEYCVPPPSPCK